MLDLWWLVGSLRWAQHFQKKLQNLLLYANKQGKLGGNYSKAETIQGRKLIYKWLQKSGNYSKEERNIRRETIQGNTVLGVGDNHAQTQLNSKFEIKLKMNSTQPEIWLLGTQLDSTPNWVAGLVWTQLISSFNVLLFAISQNLKEKLDVFSE